MAKGKGARRSAPPPLPFAEKLVLNQWVISLFGVDPLVPHVENGEIVRPFRLLARPLETVPEGLGEDGLHHFFHALAHADYFIGGAAKISKADLQRYEENIVSHTLAMNARRRPEIKWKYFQWLSLVFTEIYLERWFTDPSRMLMDLNSFVADFNVAHHEYADVETYEAEDLNKICFQNATGSGKTLLMHVHYRQFWHYAKKYGCDGRFNLPFLLTPKDKLSEQHRREMSESGIRGIRYEKGAGGELGEYIYTLEIQKVQNEDGPETVAVRNLGDNNLLFVDEGHAGLSSPEANTWAKHRARMCEKGFSFEYSATFQQAVSGTAHEDAYAKAVLFDYSYRWFYEDGYGKDYRIHNIPDTFEKLRFTYLTGALLKSHQQLRLYEEKKAEYAPFNVEKPLWVFVGGTVTGGKKKLSAQDRAVATDVAEIIGFFAKFLSDSETAIATIDSLLFESGAETGMIDSKGNDIFGDSFGFLLSLACGEERNKFAARMYADILARFFNGASPGKIEVVRLRGDSGEILLRAPNADVRRPFGLVYVGSPKELEDHLKGLDGLRDMVSFAPETEAADAMFTSLRGSSSPVNLLIGSKKFVEGWDCWRVSSLGLMHVGRSEGAQIIQLFGRGVRLKGWKWSLKRSGRSGAPTIPKGLQELEVLNVFGIEADFMATFRDALKKEGLPGNEKICEERIPLNVTYNFGKKLKVVRPKRKKSDGKEYDFRTDGPIATIGGEVPAWIIKNPVKADWYPRIVSMVSEGAGADGEAKYDSSKIGQHAAALLDYDALYFALEKHKRERGWHNLAASPDGIRALFGRTDWYELLVPRKSVVPDDFAGLRTLREIADDLLKNYAKKLYGYARSQYIDPRLETRELSATDGDIPSSAEYLLRFDGDSTTLAMHIATLKSELAAKKNELIPLAPMAGVNLGMHLFEPLLHVRKPGEIVVAPMSLNESEFKFVEALCEYAKAHPDEISANGRETYLLRNVSTSKGMGFAEASNFHPDFILWIVEGERQYITFIEPHGLVHEAEDSDKIMFCKRVKNIEQRLADKNVVLNSFILSPTSYCDIVWRPVPHTKWLAENRHILFMEDGGEKYLKSLFGLILAANQIKDD